MSLDPQVDLFREYSIPDEDKLSDEWYTPEGILAPAREFLGRIDLDPCSCEAANKEVGADNIYTMEDDGLAQAWGFARTIWMNPPYSKPLPWIEKIVDWSGPKHSALVLIKTDHSTKWWAEMMSRSIAICQLNSRVSHWGPNKPGRYGCIANNFCSTVACIATRDRVDEFAEIFKPLGYVFERRG